MTEFFGCMLAHEGAAAALRACKAAAVPASAAAECGKSRSFADFVHLTSTKVGGQARRSICVSLCRGSRTVSN